MEYQKASVFSSRKLRNSHGVSRKNVYDEAFAGGGKLGSGVEDYREIFGGSAASSIPILDVPELNERKGVNRQSWRVDYSEIFGGFGEAEFAMPYEDLLAKPKRVRAPDETKLKYAEPKRSNLSGKEKVSSPEASFNAKHDVKQFNVSYHKTHIDCENGTNGTTHVAKLNAIPGYTCLIDDITPPQKNEPGKPVHSVSSDSHLNSNFGEESRQGKPRLKAVSGPQPRMISAENSSTIHSKLQKNSTHNRSISHDISFDVFEIDLGIHPSGSAPPPPPSGLSPDLLNNHGNSSWSIKSKFWDARNDGSESRAPFLDEDIDANSAAASSTAALQKAIEEAQAKIKIAKELMERRRSSNGLKAEKLSSSSISKTKNRAIKATEETKKSEETGAQDIYQRKDVQNQVSADFSKHNALETSQETSEMINERFSSVPIEANSVEPKSTQMQVDQPEAGEVPKRFSDLAYDGQNIATELKLEQVDSEKFKMPFAKEVEWSKKVMIEENIEKPNEQNKAIEGLKEDAKMGKFETELNPFKKFFEWNIFANIVKSAKELYCQDRNEEKVMVADEDEGADHILKLSSEDVNSESDLKNIHEPEENTKCAIPNLEGSMDVEEAKEFQNWVEIEKKQAEKYHQEGVQIRIDEVTMSPDAVNWEKENEKGLEEARNDSVMDEGTGKKLNEDDKGGLIQVEEDLQIRIDEATMIVDDVNWDKENEKGHEEARNDTVMGEGTEKKLNEDDKDGLIQGEEDVQTRIDEVITSEDDVNWQKENEKGHEEARNDTVMGEGAEKKLNEDDKDGLIQDEEDEPIRTDEVTMSVDDVDWEKENEKGHEEAKNDTVMGEGTEKKLNEEYKDQLIQDEEDVQISMDEVTMSVDDVNWEKDDEKGHEEVRNDTVMGEGTEEKLNEDDKDGLIQDEEDCEKNSREDGKVNWGDRLKAVKEMENSVEDNILMNETEGRRERVYEKVESERIILEMQQSTEDERNLETTEQAFGHNSFNFEVADEYNQDETEDMVVTHDAVGHERNSEGEEITAGLKTMEEHEGERDGSESDSLAVDQEDEMEESESRDCSGLTQVFTGIRGINKQVDTSEVLVNDKSGEHLCEIKMNFQQKENECHMTEEKDFIEVCEWDEKYGDSEESEIGSNCEENGKNFISIHSEEWLGNRIAAEKACGDEKCSQELPCELGETHDDVKKFEVDANNKTDDKYFDSSLDKRQANTHIDAKTSQKPCLLEEEETTTEVSQERKTNESTRKEEENHDQILTREEKEVEDNFEKGVMMENDTPQQKEAKNRDVEKEKERIAVEKAIREARERAFAEAKERAGRAAATEAQSGVTSRARKRWEKPSTQANYESAAEKASLEAKLKAERAAVERATAEARERALEKAMSDKARSKSGGSSTDKFSRASRDGGISKDQQKKEGPSSISRYPSSGENNEADQRCKVTLERNQRTAERTAKALAEKNMRDLLAQKEQAERNRLAETLDAEVKRWSSGKERNLRALLSTLQYILGPDSGWQPIPLVDLVPTAAVKKAYRKATLCVHPDKLQQRGASMQQKYTCEKVFDLLKEAWNKFNSEEQ